MYNAAVDSMGIEVLDVTTIPMERELGTAVGSRSTEVGAFLLLSTEVGSMSTEHGLINL